MSEVGTVKLAGADYRASHSLQGTSVATPVTFDWEAQKA